VKDLTQHRLGLVVTVLLCGAVFLGTLTGLTDHFLGIEYVDHYGTQWFYWFAEHQLRALQGFGHTDLMFYPYGKDIYLHTGANVLDAIVAVPFRMIFGGVLGYNLFLIFGLGLSGYAFYSLARDFTEDRSAALIAATFVTLSPFVLTEVAEGRPTQAILVFPILFFRDLWRSGARGGLRAPLLAGLWLALTGYQYWFYAFFGGMVALAHGLTLAFWPGPEAGGRARILARHALIAAVALLLTLPATLSLLLASQAGQVPGMLDVSGWADGAIRPQTSEGTGIGLFLWQPLRGMSGFLAGTDPASLQYLPQGDLTPWVSMIAMAAALFRPGRLRRAPALAMFAMGTVLAMGPVILLDDAWLPNPPYVWLVRNVAFLRRLWWPSRAYVYTDLLYGVFLAVALTWAGQVSGRARAAAATVAALLWGWHLSMSQLLPFPSWDATVPAGYRCLAGGDPGALLELPFSWTQAHLYWQTVHQRPIFGGMLENNELFAPEESVKLREDNSFVAGLLALTRSAGEIPLSFSREDEETFGKLGYRYVVLERDAFNPPPNLPGLADNAARARLRRMRQQLTRALGEPVYEDARVNIYAPWGDPAPCDVGAWTRDAISPGNTENTNGLRMNVPPGDTRLRPLFTLPDNGQGATVEDADHDGAATAPPPR